MSQEYAQHVLKVAVAQICRTIGWHSTHASTMDLLIDVTQHFLREISRIMHRYCELYNRTEANLDDLALAYKEIGINLDELMEYVQFVDPIPLTLEVPRFPLPKESNLNFLKPGSREVLTRPVHIPEYMPPLMFETEEDGTERTGNDDERRAAFGEAKSLLNSAAIAIATVAATISSDARAITDGGCSGIGVAKGPVSSIEEVNSTGEGVDDGSNLPHAVINEEVEIPMQTIEVKEQSTGAVGGDEESVTASKLSSENAVKEKPAQIDDTVAGGSKSAIPTEEGRPTREISSVIMTTSGFISPAREGKLPESRIPIIPEERPIQQPTPVVSTVPALSATHHLALPTGAAMAGAPSLAGSAPVSSAALLASAAGSYFPKPNAPDGTLGVGVPPGTPGSVGLGVPSDPSQPPTKLTGEKSTKKVKKKPVDREKKKAEKGLGNAARKQDKHATGEKSTMVKQHNTLDATIEHVVKEETDFTTPLPPDALLPGRVADNIGIGSNPFIKNSSFKPGWNEALNAMEIIPGAGLVATNVSGKPAKPAKVKVVKEKAVKKRKSAAPKPVPVPGEMLIDDPALLNRQLPIPNFLPFPTPKPKKAPKSSKKAANQRGQFDAVDQPPPLIGPLGLGTSVGNSTLVGPMSVGSLPPVKPDHLFGMMPNAGIGSPTTAALSLPLKKPPIGPFKQDEHEAQQVGTPNPLVDQAAQLNLLQKMHPSLEITASPSIASQEVHEKPLTPGRMIFDGKGMKPDTTSDRDVIVIDDDKSPPHVSSLPATMTTPTNKKQRKQAAHTNVPGGVVGMHGQTFGLGSVGGAGAYDGEYRPDDPLNYSPLSNAPKTPDIRLHSSSSSTPSWMNESPRLATPKKGTSNLFSELSSKTLTECMAQNRTPEALKPTPLAVDGGKKPKRPKQKPKTDAKLGKLADGNKKLEQESQKFGNLPSQNPFALYPGSMNPFAPDASVYSKFLNQSLQAVAGMRNPMPFGMFPLPSGPGLIPDNPLFPRMPPTYPGQHRPGFQMPPNPFVLPGMNPMNLLRMPTLANRLPGMAGMGGPSGSQRDFLDEPLDPETKLAQTPLDLQKSTCNVAPLVPPSLFQSATESMTLSGGANELLNLSVKSTASPGIGRDTIVTSQTMSTKKDTAAVTVSSGAGNNSSISSQSIFGSTSSVMSTVKEGKPEPVRESYKEDQVVILPAASVLPGASPPQRSSMLVVDVDDSDGSQSTAGGKSKDGKRKQKEHKKDRKLKDGKIKKKKDKKDKSKSKDRDREQLKELTAGTATSPGVMTMGMIGAEEALMEQLRKERKEKKEKRKEKVKKEKRKEKERLGAIGSGGSPGGIGQPSVGPSASATGETVPKLMLKLGGSNATQSPRSETPDKAYMEQLLLGAASMVDPKRDGSPELARISALVTRPPKLKGSIGTTVAGKSKKDDAGKNIPLGSPLPPNTGTEQLKLQPSMDTDETFAALKQSVKVNFSTSTVGSTASALVNYATTDDSSTGAAGTSTSRGSKVARLADNAADVGVKPFTGGEAPKKAMKESKGSKSVHHHHHHHAAAETYTTPVHMTDVDGNTVWICPACGRVDDGTPMIGCDGCDAWYHWVCVGIQVPPDDNEDWYCRVCIAKKQDTQADEKQRKRKKKDKKTSKD